jgi:hypothetical protein
VTVDGLADGQVSVTFERVLSWGETSAPAVDISWATLPVVYSTATALAFAPATTASVSGNTRICVSFDPNRFQNLSSVRLFVKVTVDDPTAGEWQDWNTVGDPTTGRLCTAVSGSDFSTIVLAEPGPSSIVMVGVTDPVGRPITDMPVLVENEAGSVVAGGQNRGVYSPDGTIVMSPALRPGTYRLVNGSIQSAHAFYINQPFSVPDGVGIVSVSVVLPTSPSLVISSRDEMGAPVYACYQVNGASQTNIICGEGDISFANLPAGEYSIAASPDDWVQAPEWYTTSFTGETVTVPAGPTAHVAVIYTMRADATLTISTVDENGAPAPGICYYLASPSNFRFQEHACSDAQGIASFFFDEVGPVVLSHGDLPEGYRKMTPVTVDPAVTPMLTRSVVKARVSAVVHALTTSGIPIEGFCASVRAVGESEWTSGGCDGDRFADPPNQDGRVVFYDLPSGDYEFSLYGGPYGGGYYYQPITISTTLDNTQIVQLFGFLPEEVGTSLLTIRAVDPHGTLLQGACYTLVENDHAKEQFRATCDSWDGTRDGVLRFATESYDVPPGTYRLIESQAPDGAYPADPVTVTIGVPDSLNPLTVNVTHTLFPNTPVGEQVTVAVSSGAEIRFGTVTTEGATTVTPVDSSQVPDLPANFMIDAALFYDISTTASFNGSVEVCLTFDPHSFAYPENAQLLHYEGGRWVDVTSSRDGSGRVCGRVTSFSPFAIAEPVTSTTPLTIVGFDSPVTMGSSWNTVKGGSTVPLKFEVFRGNEEQTSVDVIASVAIVQVSCSAATGQATIQPTSGGSTALTYSDGAFHQNWKTPKSAGSCYRVTVTTVDGATIDAYFKLK